MLKTYCLADIRSWDRSCINFVPHSVTLKLLSTSASPPSTARRRAAKKLMPFRPWVLASIFVLFIAAIIGIRRSTVRLNIVRRVLLILLSGGLFVPGFFLIVQLIATPKDPSDPGVAVTKAYAFFSGVGMWVAACVSFLFALVARRKI